VIAEEICVDLLLFRLLFIPHKDPDWSAGRKVRGAQKDNNGKSGSQKFHRLSGQSATISMS